MSEKQLTNAIIELLNYTGKGFFWRVNSGAMKYEYKGKSGIVRLAQAGTSDIQGIRKKDGKMICLEVKLPGNLKTLTQLQSAYLDKMKSYGAITGVVTSIEDALQAVQEKV